MFVLRVCVLAALIAGEAVGGESFNCEATFANPHEGQQHSATLLVDDDWIVLSHGELISVMRLISDKETLAIYDVFPSAFAVLSQGKQYSSLQIIHPHEGSHQSSTNYVCRQ